MRHASALWFQVARRDGVVTVALLDGARLESLERLTARLLPILSGGALGPPPRSRRAPR